MCFTQFQADSSENTPNRLSIPTYIRLCLTWVCCLHLRNRFAGLACVRALCSSALGPPFAAPFLVQNWNFGSSQSASDCLLDRWIHWCFGGPESEFWRVSIFGEQVFYRLSATLCSLVVMKLPQVVSLCISVSLGLFGYSAIVVSRDKKKIHLAYFVLKK